MRYVYLQGMGSQGGMIETMGLSRLALKQSSAHGCVKRAVSINGNVLHYFAVWQGEARTLDEPLAVAEMAFAVHNVDDRPRGREIRSMSVGDVVVVQEIGPVFVVLFCNSTGWVKLEGHTAEALEDIARRNAYGAIMSEPVFKTLVQEVMAEV